jgi:colanic acid/amylovoran biosynthesis glycosyltransferase
MKRLAYLLADFPVLSETFIGNEIRAMRRKGHEVLPLLMTLREGLAQPEDRLLAETADQLRDLPNGLESLFRPSVAGLSRALQFVLSQKRLPRASLLYQSFRIGRFFRDRGIDHVHAHFAGGAAAHALVAARLAGITSSFVCHGHDVYAEPEDLPLKLASADLTVAVCTDLARDLAAISSQAKLVQVPCGIDPDRFRFCDQATSNGRILFIGRLVAQKGIDDLITALALLPPDARPALDVVGDGPLRETLQRQVKAVGLADVQFLGPKPAQWLVENGARYLALVAPFKIAPDGARDTGPLVVKEAMAIGLPVISTAFMGVKDTLDTETGFLVPPADPLGLHAALRVAMQQGQLNRTRMVHAARERVARLFSLSASAERLSAAFEGLAP